MGATFIEDQEILLVIEDNCKQLGLQPLAPEPSEQEVAIQEFSNLLPDTLTTKKARGGLGNSETSKQQSVSRAKKEDIEKHIFSEFKRGLTKEGREEEGEVSLTSSVVKLAEEPFAYSLFRWFIDKPENEWVDGFLFQVADKNPEIVSRLVNQEKIIKFRTKLQRIGSSVRSIDRDDAIYSATFKYTEEEKLVLESLRGLKDQSTKVEQSLNALSSSVVIGLMEFGDVRTSEDFVENSFFKRRLQEHASNQQFVRDKLRPFFESKEE